MDFDFGQHIKSIKDTVDTSTQTLAIPSDCVDVVKIGVVGSDGMVYVLANNKNINYSHTQPSAGSTDSVPDKTPTATPGALLTQNSISLSFTTILPMAHTVSSMGWAEVKGTESIGLIGIKEELSFLLQIILLKWFLST